MNIVLFGYRGSGKTTVGRLLADKLWKTFVDTDQECCKRLDNPSIADIWARQGEKAWRDMECQVTREMLARDEMVIALGGGTLMQEPARQAVADADHALRIYLQCEPEVLHRRIAADVATAQTRPNLTNLGGGLEEIKAVLAQRDPVYRAAADQVLKVSDLSPQQTVDQIIRRFL